MKNLIIDIGNTTVKLAVYEFNQILYYSKSNSLIELDILEIAAKHKVNQIICSSVKNHSTNNFQSLKNQYNFIWFNHQTKIPINNNYKQPDKLGLDRLAGVIGGNYLHPNCGVLVIDAGTCITYDYIHSNKNYYGGSITPGIEMRLKALQNYTSKLPLIKFNQDFGSIFGSDTETSILSGVINGVIGEVKEFIEIYNKLSNHLKVVICGGNASFFDSKLKSSIFAHQISLEPDLVLLGLNKVLSYQNE